MHSGLAREGAADFQGQGSVEGSRLRLQGRAEGTGGAFEGVSVPRFASQVAWDEKGLHLRKLDFNGLGGGGTLDVEVPPVPGLARLEGKLREVDTEGLARVVFNLGPLGVAGAASGTVALNWPRGHARALSGTMTL